MRQLQDNNMQQNENDEGLPIAYKFLLPLWKD
jgi:hypothetical protein